MEKFKARQTWGTSRAVQRQGRLATVIHTASGGPRHFRCGEGMDGFQEPVLHQDQPKEPAPQALYTSRYKETMGIGRQG